MARSGDRTVASIRWYRWPGAISLAAAILSFLTAVSVELAAPGKAANAPFFWAAVALNGACLVILPLLLFRAIRFHRLQRKAWRAVVMRAVWGGPFGTLGALWDLTSDRPEAEAPGAIR